CPGFWPWYFKFLGRYWGFNSLVRLALFLFILIFVGNVSPLRLVIFWAVPLCLSSLQLFYFGTYQPHRWHDRGAAPERDRAICAQSPDRPWLISLVACYHFSYHQEHHDYPDVAWWALPSLYRSLQQQPSQSPRSPKLGPKIEPKSGLKIGPKTWPDRCLELPPAAPLRLSQLD
ncbi:MAG: hypothetical protein HC824_21980, partial [Synechococcales cyanobacterium RM1_1_8]|nr:hypothetical protein [Synechococcales cyanobacterium RM1_1_8]